MRKILLLGIFIIWVFKQVQATTNLVITLNRLAYDSKPSIYQYGTNWTFRHQVKSYTVTTYIYFLIFRISQTTTINYDTIRINNGNVLNMNMTLPSSPKRMLIQNTTSSLNSNMIISDSNNIIAIYKINASNAYQKMYSSPVAANGYVFGVSNCAFYINRTNSILYRVSTTNYSSVTNYSFVKLKLQPVAIASDNGTVIVYNKNTVNVSNGSFYVFNEQLSFATYISCSFIDFNSAISKLVSISYSSAHSAILRTTNSSIQLYSTANISSYYSIQTSNYTLPMESNMDAIICNQFIVLMTNCSLYWVQMYSWALIKKQVIIVEGKESGTMDLLKCWPYSSMVSLYVYKTNGTVASSNVYYFTMNVTYTNLTNSTIDNINSDINITDTGFIQDQTHNISTAVTNNTELAIPQSLHYFASTANLVVSLFFVFIVFCYSFLFYPLIFAYSKRKYGRKVLQTSKYILRGIWLQTFLKCQRTLFQAFIHGAFINKQIYQLTFLIFMDVLDCISLIYLRKCFKFTIQFILIFAYFIFFLSFNLTLLVYTIQLQNDTYTIQKSIIYNFALLIIVATLFILAALKIVVSILIQLYLKIKAFRKSNKIQMITKNQNQIQEKQFQNITKSNKQKFHLKKMQINSIDFKEHPPKQNMTIKFRTRIFNRIQFQNQKPKSNKINENIKNQNCFLEKNYCKKQQKKNIQNIKTMKIQKLNKRKIAFKLKEKEKDEQKGDIKMVPSAQITNNTIKSLNVSKKRLKYQKQQQQI